jgi:hypothetical protein
MFHTIACLDSEIELLKSNVSCDSCVGMLAENEKLKLDYSTCAEQLKIARAEIIEINSMHSSTCSSTLNNDTCVDSIDNHDVLLDINACNVSTIAYVSCIDLKYEIDDFKQVRDDMNVKLVEHNEKSANLEKVRQSCDLIDACHENNYFKANLDGSHIDVSPPKSLHNDMSDNDCNFCLVVMKDLAKLRNVHAQVANQLESTICELDEFKTRPSLLGACLECPKLKLELDVCSLNVKKLETKLLKKSHVSVTSSLCEFCASLRSKLVRDTNENTMLMLDVAYLTSRLERTKLSEKMIEEDLSRIDECVTRSIHKLGLSYERYEDKGEISTKFVPSSTYNDEEKTLKAKQIPYPPNPKSSFNLKRKVNKETLKPREDAFICMLCGRAGHLNEFCFRRKRMEKRRHEYARNSYHDEFLDSPPRSYSRVLPHSYSCASSRIFSCALPHTSSRALPQFAHGPNYRSYGFGSQENHFVPRHFGYGPLPHRGDRFPRRPDFPAGGSYTHFELRHLDGPHFSHCGSRPTRPNGEVERIVKTSSSRMFKCWISKIYLTHPSTEPSTSSHPR